MKTCSIIVLAIVFFGLMAPARTADEIVKKNLEARGGVEKIKAIKTTRMVGKMMMQSFEMPFTMWYRSPAQVKMEMQFQGAVMTFCYDGKIVWQISPFTGSTDPQELTGEQAEQMKDSADLMDEPFVDYEKKGHKIELAGKENLEGTEVFKLKLTRKNGQEMYYFIDAESFIELKTTTTKKKPDGTAVVVDTVFGDFKPVADVLMPHSLAMTANQQTMNLVIETVEPNLTLAEDFFSMPPKKTEPAAEQPKK